MRQATGVICVIFVIWNKCKGDQFVLQYSVPLFCSTQAHTHRNNHANTDISEEIRLYFGHVFQHVALTKELDRNSVHRIIGLERNRPT